MTQFESLPISLTRPADAVGDDAGYTVVWVSGEHDISTGVSLGAVIARASELDNVDVLVDLSQVTFMDASIVNVLVRSQKELSARGLILHIRAPSPAALHTLRVCGATSLLALVRVRPRRAAAALATWVDVPAQPTADGDAQGTAIAPASHEPEPAMAVEADRGGR